MKRRQHIEYNYRTFTGVILSNHQVDYYNGIQDDINRFIDNKQKVPEWLLNWSHKYFNSCATLTLQK